MEREREVCVFFFNGYGDAVLVLPTLRALSSILGKRLLILTADAPHAFMFRDLGAAMLETVTFRPGSGVRRFDWNEGVQKVGRCNIFVNLHTWMNDETRRLIDVLRPVHTIGWTDEFDTKLDGEGRMHWFDKYYRLVEMMGSTAPIETYAYPLQKGGGAKGLKKIVALHFDTLAAKSLCSSQRRVIVMGMLERYPQAYLRVVGEDLKWAEQYTHPSPRLMVARGSLRSAFKSVAEADYFIGVDSCMLHVADLCGIPGIGIFGPTSPAAYGYRFGRGGVVLGKAEPLVISTEALFGYVDEHWADG